jgi:hypothetical protein
VTASRTTFIEEAEALLARLAVEDLPAAIVADREYVTREFRVMINQARTGSVPSVGELQRGLCRLVIDQWPLGREPGGDLAHEVCRLEAMFRMIWPGWKR